MPKDDIVNASIGLSSSEVEKSKAKWGDNSISNIKVVTFFDRFKKNLQDPMVIILIVALIVTLIFAFLGYTSPYEGIGIFFAIAIATIVSTLSEHKSENSFRILQEEASKVICKVFRDGKVANIYINEIVKGDFVLIQAGDIIPADGVVFKGKAKVNQASLNGESKLAIKDENLTSNEQSYLSPNRVFRGSILVEGELIIEVDAIGEQSEYGKLSKELLEETREAPLKVTLSKLANSIANFAYIASIFISFVFFFYFYDYSLSSLLASWSSDYMSVILNGIKALTLAIIIIIMAVPEGLPMMIAMVLSLNMRKLIKDSVLVRKLTGIEASGSLNILFSDKTGTITKGKLEVVKFISGGLKEFNEFNTVPENISNLLLHTIVNGSSAKIVHDEDGSIQVIGGNQTDQALSHYISKHINEAEDCHILSKIAFNSEWKFSAHLVSGSLNTTLIKGAPEVILQNAKSYIDENGQIKEIDRASFEERLKELAKKSMRIIAFGYSNEEISEDNPLLPKELILVGMVAIRDDIRSEAIGAIREAQSAGVQVVMVTGDNLETAKAIAKDAGILVRDDEIILTSDKLNNLSDSELKELLPKVRVIARAKPTDKSRLVKIAQELNLVVGMTGDGVNDAPALKRADVGFAMGDGTELAKEASDIVILDNNFASIEKAILYGRTIYNSIQKFIIYQLSVNVSAVLIALIAPFFGYEMPFSLIQILWINLIMDTLAALALGGEPALRAYMSEKPKVRGAHPIDKYMLLQILFSSAFIIVVSFIFLLEFKELFETKEVLLTAFFSFFIFINLFNAFNVRGKEFNIFANILKNNLFLIVVASIFILQITLVTFGGELFRAVPLAVSEWVLVIALATLILPYGVALKAILNRVVK